MLFIPNKTKNIIWHTWSFHKNPNPPPFIPILWMKCRFFLWDPSLISLVISLTFRMSGLSVSVVIILCFSKVGWLLGLPVAPQKSKQKSTFCPQNRYLVQRICFCQWWFIRIIIGKHKFGRKIAVSLSIICAKKCNICI